MATLLGWPFHYLVSQRLIQARLRILRSAHAATGNRDQAEEASGEQGDRGRFRRVSDAGVDRARDTDVLVVREEIESH